MAAPRKLNIAGAEEHTGIPRDVIKNAVTGGYLRAFRPNGPKGHLFFDAADLDAWVAAADTLGGAATTAKAV